MSSGPEELREWIGKRFGSYTEAADHLGLDASVVTKLANGTRNAGLKIALLLHRKTGIPVDAWVSDDEDIMAGIARSNIRKSKSDK